MAERLEKGSQENFTCVAAYTMDAHVTLVIPWIRAFPDLVAFASLSTELGEVNICLKAYKVAIQYLHACGKLCFC